MKIYLFKEGIARFSTEKYVIPSEDNFANTYMHLTNYSLNKNNKEKFVHNDTEELSNQGHKRTFSSILEHIRATFAKDNNSEDGEAQIDAMMHKIENIIIRTIASIEP